MGLKKLFRWAALLLTASRNNGTPSSGATPPWCAAPDGAAGAGDPAARGMPTRPLWWGIFSLLDVMLSMPMESPLACSTCLSPWRHALLRREGFLGDLLTLAEACESSDDALFDRCAGLLHPTSQQINFAHLQALAWADHISD